MLPENHYDLTEHLGQMLTISVLIQENLGQKMFDVLPLVVGLPIEQQSSLNSKVHLVSDDRTVLTEKNMFRCDSP